MKSLLLIAATFVMFPMVGEAKADRDDYVATHEDQVEKGRALASEFEEKFLNDANREAAAKSDEERGSLVEEGRSQTELE